ARSTLISFPRVLRGTWPARLRMRWSETPSCGLQLGRLLLQRATPFFSSRRHRPCIDRQLGPEPSIPCHYLARENVRLWPTSTVAGMELAGKLSGGKPSVSGRCRDCQVIRHGRRPESPITADFYRSRLTPTASAYLVRK